MRFLISTLVFFVLVGCAGVVRSTVIHDEFYKQKKVLIIKSDASSYIPFQMGNIIGGMYFPPTTSTVKEKPVIGNTDIVIKKELEKRGFEVYIAGDKPITNDFQLVVRYKDTWKWDMSDYMPYLEIYFMDAATLKTNARTSYANSSETHDYPTPEKTIPKMLDDLLKTKDKAPASGRSTN
jgi:hypothetical protein